MTVDRQRTETPGVWYRIAADETRRYQVHYVCQGGCKPDHVCRGHTETLPAGSTYRQAKARRAELMARTGRGERIVTRKVHVRDFSLEWLETQEGNLAEGTLALYRQNIQHWIIPALGRKYLCDVTIDDVAKLVSSMKVQDRKAWTIRNVLNPLSRIMAHAVRRGLANTNPVLGLEKSERPKSDQRKMRILSSDEIHRLLKESPDRWRPFLAFLVFTGLRISEALRVEWEDIDLAAGSVKVHRSKTKAGERTVVLFPELVALLRQHMLASGRREGLVFTTLGGGPLNRQDTLKRVLKPAARRAGITGRITQHELRHTYASILIGMGMDVTFVADQLGHADPAITLRTYAKLFDPASRRVEAREKLQTAFGGLL